jgi:glycosyltransferase involved in cell wall biosynthesis
VTSTFPAGPDDPVPAFVRDQVLAWPAMDPGLRFAVLAPRDDRSDSPAHTRHAGFDEYRFRYAWPKRVERLAGRGILPQLKANPLYWLTVPPFVVAETLALLRLTRRLRPRLIYAHWFTPQALTAAVVGRVTGTRFVFTSHAQDAAILGRVPWIGPRVARWAAGRADAASVSSRRTRAKLDALLTPTQRASMAQRCAVIPMGADHSLMTLPVRDAPPGDTPTVLFLGRLAEKKGVQILLPAFADLRATHPRARLVIAGDGPWRDRLERQARVDLGLGDDAVHFAGYVTGDAKRALLGAADIFVLPSVTTGSDAEGLPVSLLEGLASGLLCIATASSGADEVISDGADGFLVDEGSPAQLTDALRRAFALGDDDRRRMRTQARRTAESFVWPAVAKRLHAHLLEPTVGPVSAR